MKRFSMLLLYIRKNFITLRLYSFVTLRLCDSVTKKNYLVSAIMSETMEATMLTSVPVTVR